ncbi:MAG: hypothetical protein JST47_13135 [Bacteroidetes bacterium]|nr:hypothetical protein [Bacteroidota bacterium]MBS1975311.1 hypothetical protein [Bacteroidota bacterium]
MKKYISLIIISAFVFSCKKQDTSAPGQPQKFDSHYLSNVKAYLQINLSSADYSEVDTDRLSLSKQNGAWFLRIGITGNDIARDFILLQTDSNGNCLNGNFVHLRRDSGDRSSFNGKISIESLSHENPVYRKVTDGIAQTLSCGENEESIDKIETDACDIVPSYDCTGCLPEVIVIGYVTSGSPGGGGGGISFSDYLNLAALAGGTGSGGTYTGNSSGVYSPVNPPLYTGGGSSVPPAKVSPDVTINYSTEYAKPGIDVNAFMKCFSTIPDDGATCSVTIFTDLPVNDDPEYIFNILTGATGHCFLQLTKTNGTQSVTQIVGKTTSKVVAVLGFPVPGKIVDNSIHKYNASLTMNISPQQLQTEINSITAIGNNPRYDIWENNCVDYAVGILNKIRPSNPLEVVKLLDPMSGDLYNTPQGLYMALDQLKQANGAEAKNIVTGVVQRAGTSHGACN